MNYFVKLAVVVCAFGLFSINTERCTAQELNSANMQFGHANVGEGEALQVKLLQPAGSPSGMREEQYEVSVPITRMVQQTYAVKVPYVESVIKDGVTTSNNKIRTETRTRAVPVTSIVKQTRTRRVPAKMQAGKQGKEPSSDLILKADSTQFFTLAGGSMPWSEVKTTLIKDHPILLINFPVKSIKQFGPFLNKDLIIVRRKPLLTETPVAN